MDNEENSMRDDFNAAIEDSDFDDTELKSEVIMPEGSSDDDTPESSEAAAAPEDAAAPEAAPTDEPAGDTEAAEPAEAAAEDIKAPMGFSAASREEWANVPQVIKEQIQKQEVDIRAAMANTATAKNTHTQMTKLADNYATILAGEGVSDPIQAAEGLFKTVAELRMGSPAQKAAKMGQLIQHYGIDIGMLDQSLTGAAPADTQETQMASMIDQRMAPMNQILEQLNQLQAGKAQESTNAVNAEIATFSQKAEFFNEVRNDMADLIDLADKRGVDLSTQDAYDRACSFNPEISGILKQRADAAALTTQQSSVAAKRLAGSSVAGTKSGSSHAAPMDLRGQLEASWDAQLDG